MSHLDRIRQRAKDNKREKLYEIEVPDYDGELVVLFRAAEFGEAKALVKRIAKTTEKVPEAELWAACDMLARTCVNVTGKSGEDADGRSIYVPLDEADPETPVRFDERLAELVGYTPDPEHPVRSLVRYLFPTDLSIMAVQDELLDFARRVQGEGQERLKGESAATTQ